MTNVLPPIADKRLKAEYRARFLLIGSMILLVSAICFLGALAPAEIALMTAPAVPVVAAQGSAADLKNDQAAITNTKALLAALQPITATSSLNALAAALSARPSGISINRISYNVTTNTITLVGTANTPDSVNAYHVALQNDPRFTNVSVPIGALLGEEDGSFTMTISGNF
jgi:hypothetical protein